MNKNDLLWLRSQEPEIATLILAHGAGAPMDSPYMASLCQQLAAVGINTVRFEFPYMARRRACGIKAPPNRQPVLLDCWRAVYGSVRHVVDGPLLIGGKSMGGRMASLVADELMPAGLCCFGYPFHPPGKPDSKRAEHFASMKTPTLILQGTRDPFGKPENISETGWSSAVHIQWFEEGDHDLGVRKSSGFTQDNLLTKAVEAVKQFVLVRC
jgi:predicted alpha/beta-hydrolase family hydrolase